MKLRSLLALLLSFLLLGACASGLLSSSPGVARAEEKGGSLLTVTGTGVVTVKPDQAKVSLGVLTVAATAREAQQENSARTQKIISALTRLGVPQEKIETQEYSIWPEYHYPEPKEDKPPQIVAYRVSNTLLVTLDDLGVVGRVIDAAVAAGANKVETITFLKKDVAQVQQEALARACREARAKAEAIARALGVTLTGVAAVQESTTSPLPYRLERVMAGAGGEGGTPIQPGELEVTAQVTVSYKIG